MAVDVPPHECPFCGCGNEAATGVDDPNAVPSEGDVAVCFSCGRAGIYTAERTVRRPTDAEAEEIRQDRELSALLARLRVQLLRPRG